MLNFFVLFFAVIVLNTLTAQNIYAQSCEAFLSNSSSLNLPAKRDPLRAAMYSEKLIVANALSKQISNKVQAARLLNEYTPAHLKQHLGRTQGLVEFLSSSPEQNLLEKINKEYPKGFVVKPAQAQNTYGIGIIKSFSDLEKLITSKEISLGTIDNEVFLIEELHTGTIFSDKSSEYRIHTLGSKVIRGATLNRWEYWGTPDPKIISPLEDSVEELLMSLPTWMTDQQAWSLDVTINENGIWKLIEINTNKGVQGNWSGFLLNPVVLSAYFNHLEIYHGWNFNPKTKILVKHKFANYQSYVRREFTETELETFRDPKSLVAEVLSVISTLDGRIKIALIEDPGHPDLIEIEGYIKNILNALKQSQTIGDQYWLQAKKLSGV